MIFVPVGIISNNYLLSKKKGKGIIFFSIFFFILLVLRSLLKDVNQAQKYFIQSTFNNDNLLPIEQKLFASCISR